MCLAQALVDFSVFWIFMVIMLLCTKSLIAS